MQAGGSQVFMWDSFYLVVILSQAHMYIKEGQIGMASGRGLCLKELNLTPFKCLSVSRDAQNGPQLCL